MDGIPHIKIQHHLNETGLVFLMNVRKVYTDGAFVMTDNVSLHFGKNIKKVLYTPYTFSEGM